MSTINNLYNLYNLDNKLTDEHKLLQKTVRSWLEKNFQPNITKWFENASLPKDIIKQLGDLDLFNMHLLDPIGYGIICQEIERGDSGLRSIVSVQNALVIFPIQQFGSEEQKNQYLPKLSSGEFIGCFGLTEPNSGSDPNSMQTVAKKVSGGWVLNGNKLWITNASWADIAIVWAKTEHGIRGFIVEKNTPGFSTQEIKHKLSMRASNTGELIFQDCKIPESALLPGSEAGIRAAFECLTQARYGIAWGAIGAAMTCYEKALEYSKTRQQFGVSLASKQLVQLKLVNMFTEICKGQVLNYELAQQKMQNNLDYASVSMAKMNACSEARKIALAARDILGANGISLEYDVIRHLINLETVFTYEGTDSIQHLIIGRALTGYAAF